MPFPARVRLVPVEFPAAAADDVLRALPTHVRVAIERTIRTAVLEVVAQLAFQRGWEQTQLRRRVVVRRAGRRSRRTPSRQRRH